MDNTVIEKIDAVLPQTQCRQCGFDGCLSYAQAIATGQADINQCPPGNDEGIRQLAAVLNIPPKPLNTAFGQPKPKAVALIDESKCIGCTFCIKACPVDAIVGAAKRMHTVLTAECTGCELCIAPCPMDCIDMHPLNPALIPQTLAEKQESANRARARYQFRLVRLEREKQEKQTRYAQKESVVKQTTQATQSPEDKKKAIIQAALKKAAALRAAAISSTKSL